MRTIRQRFTVLALIAVTNVSTAGAAVPTVEETDRIDGVIEHQALGTVVSAQGRRLVAAAGSNLGEFYMRDDQGQWNSVGNAASFAQYSIDEDSVVELSVSGGVIRGWSDTDPAPLAYSMPTPMSGSSVVIDGETLIVGDQALDVVRAFGWSGVDWELEYEQLGNLFGSALGSSVDYENRHAVFGNDFNAVLQTGLVYHRRRKLDGTWTAVEHFSSPGAQAGNGFGFSVSMSGPWLAVGAPFEDIFFPAPVEDAGAVYLFERDSMGEYQYQGAFFGSQPGQYFGWDVALEDGTLLVGAPGEAGSGAAHVFSKGGPSWRRLAKLVASDPSPLAAMGTAVDVAYPYLIVGAPGNDLGDGVGVADVDLEGRSLEKVPDGPCVPSEVCSGAGTVYIYSELFDPFFSDGFESSDLSSWSQVSP